MRTVDITKLSIFEIENYLRQLKDSERETAWRQERSDEIKKLYDIYKDAKFIHIIEDNHVEFGEIKEVKIITSEDPVFFNDIRIIFKNKYTIFKSTNAINLRKYNNDSSQIYYKTSNKFIITKDEYKRLVTNYKKLEKAVALSDFNSNLNEQIT